VATLVALLVVHLETLSLEVPEVHLEEGLDLEAPEA